MKPKVILSIFIVTITALILVLYILEINDFKVKDGEIADGNKIYPENYQEEIKEALSHYPELDDIEIKFKTIDYGIPFVSRPTVFSTLFRSAKKRKYLVLIAKKSYPLFDSALMHSMPYAARVGVIGHELAHTTDFIQRNWFRMLRVAIGNLSSSFLDQFERETDYRTIDHKMGCELLAWSSWVRTHLQLEEDPNVENIMTDIEKNERYLKPVSIVKYIEESGTAPCHSSYYYK